MGEPVDELIVLRNLLERLRSGSLTMMQGGKDVTRRETGILKRAIARLENIIGQSRSAHDDAERPGGEERAASAPSGVTARAVGVTMRRYLTIGGLIAGLIILFVLHFLHPVTVVANAPVIAESLRKSSPRFPAPVPEPGSAIPTIDSDVMLAMKV